MGPFAGLAFKLIEGCKKLGGDWQQVNWPFFPQAGDTFVTPGEQSCAFQFRSSGFDSTGLLACNVRSATPLPELPTSPSCDLWYLSTFFPMFGQVGESPCQVGELEREAFPRLEDRRTDKSCPTLASLFIFDFEPYCGWTKSCTTFKPWKTIVCWYLQGGHHCHCTVGVGTAEVGPGSARKGHCQKGHDHPHPLVHRNLCLMRWLLQGNQCRERGSRGSCKKPGLNPRVKGTSLPLSGSPLSRSLEQSSLPFGANLESTTVRIPHETYPNWNSVFVDCCFDL